MAVHAAWIHPPRMFAPLLQGFGGAPNSCYRGFDRRERQAQAAGTRGCPLCRRPLRRPEGGGGTAEHPECVLFFCLVLQISGDVIICYYPL